MKFKYSSGDVVGNLEIKGLAGQHYVGSLYGKGFYTVKQCKQGSDSDEYTASGSTTRKCTGSWLEKS